MKFSPVSAEIAVRIPAGHTLLDGELVMPPEADGLADGLVLFAHGSGSSRRSPRNQFVARELRRAGLGTLLMDLLTPEEEQIDFERGHLRFDIPFLARRLMAATAWAETRPETQGFRIGYFGASTGGAAALVAASELGESIGAVVSRGGRPDLAGVALPRVKAPTLLIVGGQDQEVLRMNAAAFAMLQCEKELRVVEGASHLFPEPGALEEVARLAAAWFRQHLGSPVWVPSVGGALDVSVRGE